jgi:hypothetical protein
MTDAAKRDILDHLEFNARTLGRLASTPTKDADWLDLVRRKEEVYRKAILTLKKEWEREEK